MLEQPLTIARKILLSPFDLHDHHLSSVIDYLLSYKIDTADLYFQSIHRESWQLENDRVKQGSFSVEQGVGMRATSGSQSGFAYSHDLRFPALLKVAKAAREITRGQREVNRIAITAPRAPQSLYLLSNPLTSLSDADKLALLYPLNREARCISHYVTQVNASLQADYEVILILDDDGRLVADVRPMVTMRVIIFAEKNGRREQGYAVETIRSDYTTLIRQQTPIQLVEEAVRQAVLNLDAKPAPAGTMPVVLGPGGPGVLIHEAVGHGLEGDFNRKGSSAFSGRIGQPVASSLCTIIDNGTLAEHPGSLNIDDEGTPTQQTVLIENGILKQYLQDKLNARLMNTQSTGNGRRESYRYLPMPRMTNTYIQQGQHAPCDIIASVDRGLYAVDFSGGQVDITSGKFVFSTSKAFLIQNGKITYPVKNATLIGNGPDVLTRVSAVGHDLKIDKGGWCGKEGQTVRVSVGQPTIKIDALTVGGTAKH